MKIIIEFFTYWHCGSGTSGGSRVDALVAKDKNGLPYIPGKTLKGHIREMAESLGDCKFLNLCFGGTADENEPCYKIEDKEKEGVCYFSNAVLKESVNKDLTSYLYKTISATKIDDKGLAVDKSLREIEVTVPLTLHATIEDCPDSYKDKMKKAIRQIKRIGLNRSRGLGRCEIYVEGEKR